MVISGISIQALLETYGYAAVFAAVGLESTGIPFPGETMLIAAALYAAGGHLQIALVIISAVTGAILGDNLGYLIGRRFGRQLVLRYGRRIGLNKKKLRLAERFFERHGDKTVFIGRFVSLLRTWAAFLAGVNAMTWPKFLLFNAAGGICWSVTYGFLAYKVGKKVPIDRIGAAGLVIMAILVVILFILHRRGLDLERLILGREEDDRPTAAAVGSN